MTDSVDWSRFTASDEARDDFLSRLYFRTTLDAIRTAIQQHRTARQAVAYEVDRVLTAMVRDGAPRDLFLFSVELLRRGRPEMTRRVAKALEDAALRRSSSHKPRRSSRPSKADSPASPLLSEEVQR
jgi:hypothetical protein